MTSELLYQQAYEAHYTEADAEKALAGYRSVIEQFPASAEAGYARIQIQNIERDRAALDQKCAAQNRAAETTTQQCVTLTTAPTLEGYRVVKTVEVITSECAFGMNILRDFLASMSDVFGGRSTATQKVLRDARKQCLEELRREAAALGANAVIAVDLDYSEFSGQGKSMLFLVASGTAVVVEKVACDDPRSNPWDTAQRRVGSGERGANVADHE